MNLYIYMAYIYLCRLILAALKCNDLIRAGLQKCLPSSINGNTEEINNDIYPNEKTPYHYDLLEKQKSLRHYGLNQLNVTFFWTLVMPVVKYVAHYIFLQKLPDFLLTNRFWPLVYSIRTAKLDMMENFGNF